MTTDNYSVDAWYYLIKEDSSILSRVPEGIKDSVIQRLEKSPKRGRHSYPKWMEPNPVKTEKTEDYSKIVKEVLVALGVESFNRRKRVRENIAWALVALLGGILVGVILKSTVIPTSVTVIGDSMYPTYHNGQKVYMYPKLGGYKVNDVVIVQEDDKKVIKRIIAVAGDTVSREGIELKVNGKRVALVTKNSSSNGYMQEGVSVKVGPGTYFILGDNVNNSKDSRTVGTVGENKILGLVK